MHNNLLTSTNHREFDLPNGPWVMTQTWENILFLHWPVSKQALKEYIPHGLELDTYNQEAWISLIPFRVRRMRLRKLPRAPYFHTFLELNVRTYVKCRGIKGVYFFSLDASKVHAVLGARMATLPYFYANMRMKKDQHTFTFESQRFGSHAAFKASYQPTGEAFYPETNSLNYWLAERYFLWTKKQHRLYQVGIHHQPWKMQQAQVHVEQPMLPNFLSNDVLNRAPLATYTPAKVALFWMVQRIK
ncbi:YqjF family protein [Lentibacillus songyuanensis]|uniref:YqjF family protein n=1 Tax=Lentibacillus songyuanensis TaxID=3136161 RepID=UPI0031BB5EB0